MSCASQTARCCYVHPPMYRLAFLLGLLVLIIPLAVGCQRLDYQVAPVSGQVTLDGKPLAGVHVLFQPRAKGKQNLSPGPGSTGTTDNEGRFELETLEPTRRGAVVGTHIVRISTRADSMIDPSELDNLADMPDLPPVSKPPKVQLPPCWTDGSEQFEVPPEGTDQANFHITTQE